jgi:hypothetical protein
MQSEVNMKFAGQWGIAESGQNPVFGVKRQSLFCSVDFVVNIQEIIAGFPFKTFPQF